MAITWRNIAPVNHSASNALLVNGGNQIGRGLQSLQDAARTVQDSEIAEYEQAGADNTAQALNALNNFRADDNTGRGSFLESQSGLNVNQSELANANRQQTTAQNIRSLMMADDTKKNDAINTRVDKVNSAFDSSIDYSTGKAFAKDADLNNKQKVDNFKQFAKDNIAINEGAGVVNSRALDAYLDRLAKESALKSKSTNNFTSINSGRQILDQTTGKVTDNPNYKSTGLNDDGIALSSINPTTGKPYTIAERKAQGFMKRGEEALADMDNQINGGYNPASISEKLIAGVPLIGNLLASKEHQQYVQASDNFLKAVLRDESGAAIPETEIASYTRTYTPQIGDSIEVVEQKRKSLDFLQEQFRIKSGLGEDFTFNAPKPPKSNASNADTPDSTNFTNKGNNAQNYSLEELQRLAGGAQ